MVIDLGKITDRIQKVLSSSIRYSGAIGGLMMAGHIDPEFCKAILSSMGGTFLCKVLDPSEPDPELGRIDEELDKDDIIRKLCLTLTGEDLDWKVMEALPKLEPDLAERIWQKYAQDLDDLKENLLQAKIDHTEHKEDLRHVKTAFEKLQDLLTRPHFKVLFMPSQLYPFIRGLMPHQLVKRPELEPITTDLLNGSLRQVAIIGRPLTGKSVLAVQVALEWLKQPGRAVAYLQHGPASDDYVPLANLDPDLHLIICDPHYTELGALSLKDLERLISFQTRLIVCQKTGQSKYAEEEKGFLRFLREHDGAKYQIWNPTYQAQPPPGASRVSVSLGPVPKETVLKMITKMRGMLDRPTPCLTIPENGKEAIFEALQVPVGGGETILLGLARAFLLFAIRRAKANQSGRLTLDPSKVHELMGELGISAKGLGEDYEQVVNRVFIENIGPQEREILIVAALWQYFSQSQSLPKVALYAGFQTLYNRDLRYDDTPLRGLMETSILMWQEKEQSFRVWHPLQLESLPIEYNHGEREDWSKKSLDRIRELSFDLSQSDEEKEKRAKVLYAFCYSLLENRVFEYELANLITIIHKILAKSGPVIENAVIANNLGNLFKDLGNFNEAQRLYEEALDNYHSLAGEKPRSIRPNLAATANNLGNLFVIKGELSEARRLLEEALDTYRSLARENPRGFQPDVAMAANNLGCLLKRLGDLAEAQRLFEEAFEIRRSLAKENPQVYRPDLATATINLGNLLNIIGEYDKAGRLYKEALSTYRSLAKKNPRAYRRYVAKTANNLAALLKDLCDYTNARQLFDEALEIRRSLAEKNPQVFLPEVAKTANNLGNLLSDLGEHVEARRLLDEAMEIRRSLTEENPQVYRAELAVTASSLGNLLRNLGENAEAQYWFEEALGIYHSLVKENSWTYWKELALTANNLGNLLRDLGELAEARQLLEKALGIFRSLAKENSQAYRPELALTANNLGNLLHDLGEHNESKRMYDEALKIRRGLAKENPQALRPDVATTLHNLTIFHLDQKNWEEAAPLAAEAVVYHKLLLTANPSFFTPRLRSSLVLARRLYWAEDFQGNRESWLNALTEELTRHLNQTGAEELANLITITDAEFKCWYDKQK